MMEDSLFTIYASFSRTKYKEPLKWGIWVGRGLERKIWVENIVNLGVKVLCSGNNWGYLQLERWAFCPGRICQKRQCFLAYGIA